MICCSCDQGKGHIHGGMSEVGDCPAHLTWVAIGGN